MLNSNISRVLRITSGIIGMMMLVFVLFSAFYIAAEAGHDCSGEDCPICACIKQCENVFRGIGLVAAVGSAAITPFILIPIAAAFYSTEATQYTLVSAKVRMNN